MMKHLQSTSDQARVFLYDADDERTITFDCALADCQTQDDRLTVTIRGLDGKVLRVFEKPFSDAWEWKRDYVYRDGLLLAAVEPKPGSGETTYHLHLDHLGTPRQVTQGTSGAVALHSYYPFGGEATDPSQTAFELKFTGHERDANASSGAGMLDYMHARYCSPELGRFASVDPVLGETAIPQSWNRYAYVRNNPVRYVDPQGLESFQIYLDAQIDEFLQNGTEPYFLDENLQKAALFAMALANPLPGDEAEVVAMLAPKAAAQASGFLGKVGKLLGKRLGKAKEVPGGAGKLDYILRGSKLGRPTKGRTAQFERPGVSTKRPGTLIL